MMHLKCFVGPCLRKINAIQATCYVKYAFEHLNNVCQFRYTSCGKVMEDKYVKTYFKIFLPIDRNI